MLSPGPPQVIDPDIPVLPEFITTRIDDVSKPAVYNSPKEKPNLKVSFTRTPLES